MIVMATDPGRRRVIVTAASDPPDFSVLNFKRALLLSTKGLADGRLEPQESRGVPWAMPVPFTSRGGTDHQCQVAPL
jgi:hypothetical protein